MRYVDDDDLSLLWKGGQLVKSGQGQAQFEECPSLS